LWHFRRQTQLEPSHRQKNSQCWDQHWLNALTK
jgi:hypothetical protein